MTEEKPAESLSDKVIEQAHQSRREGRGRGGTRTQGRGGVGQVHQLPYQQPRRTLPPLKFLSDDEIESIHLASLKLLQEGGMHVLLPEAREIYQKKGGCKIDGEMVYFDSEALLESIKTAPSQFTIHARNPLHNVEMGDNWLSFCMMGSAPNVSDLEHGRRRGNYKDYANLLRLAQSLNICHLIAGHPVEPVDIPPNIRHYEAIGAMIKLTDKPFHIYSLGPDRVADALEMTRIAYGLSHSEFQGKPSVMTIINTNSPLKLDKPMANGVIELARHGQVVCITPFTLAGAMAPVSLGGALTLQNAEALAGIMLTQLAKPGAPVIYGAFTSNVDMRSGAPAFGTPEYTKAALISGQLARRYHLPYRTSNTNASNHPDAQAIYESQMSLWGAIMGGGNMIKHALGWLEGGLTCNFEKVILDAEMLQMMAEFFRPIALDEDSLAVQAIKEVGPGGHFFGSPHTLARYTEAFYSPMVSDWRNFQLWQEQGAVDATKRANQIWHNLLDQYQQPALDPAREEELDAFIARRKEEGGAKEMS